MRGRDGGVGRGPTPPVFLPPVWLCVAAAVAGFFLPWVRMDIGTSKSSKQLESAARTSLGKTFKVGGSKEPSWIRHRATRTATLPTRISGFQIPVLANRKNAKVVTDLVKLFTKRDEHLGFKSYAVYGLPGLAVVCGLLLSWGGRRRLLVAGVAVLCAAVAGGGCWTLLTTDTRAACGVAIGAGLWLSLWAYAGLAATLILHAWRGYATLAHRTSTR